MTEDRIGPGYYDSTDYFEGESAHLTNPESAFHRYRVDKVLQIREPGRDDRVLDLGCGWGTFCFALGHRVREMVGLDFSRRSVELCERRLPATGLKNVSFVCADARETGLDDGSFDLIIAADLMEHLYPDDSREVLHECFRLLRPGGYLSLWTPHRGHLLEVLKNRDTLLKRDVSHVDYKSMDRLKSLVQGANFLVEKAYYAESHVPVLRTVERAMLGFVPLLRRRIAVLGRKP